MKLMYCRVVRNFIEKKRVEKIDEYNSQNKGIHYSLQNLQEWLFIKALIFNI